MTTFNLQIIEVSFIDGVIQSMGNGIRLDVPTTQADLKLATNTDEQLVTAQVAIKRDGDVVRYRVFFHQGVRDA